MTDQYPAARPVQTNLGRQVHYKAHGSADGKYAPQCRAAIITQPETTYDEHGGEVTPASITVFNPTGLFMQESLPHDPDDQRGGTWHHIAECKGTGDPRHEVFT